MKTSTLVLVVLGLSAAPSLVPAAAFAADPAISPAAVAEGRTHFLRGVDLFRDQDYRAALVEFRRANEVAPSYRILYNLGQTYYELQDYVGAAHAFQGYLDGGATQIPRPRREQVAADVKNLQARIATLTVTVDVPGATVMIDDVDVGTSPLPAPLQVSSGLRKVTATLEGRGTATRTVEVAGTDHAAVRLELPAVTAAPPPPVVLIDSSTATGPSSSRHAQPPLGSSHTAAWVTGGATVALAATATVLGVLTLGARHDYDTALDRFPVSASTVNGDRTRVRSLALATDVVGGAAIVAAGLTVYFALRRSDPTSASVQIRGTSLAFDASF